MANKRKSNAGRPTKMDDFTVKKLEEAFLLGCSDLEACLYADISKQTLYNYQDKHPEFIDRKERLKQNPVMKARQSVIKGINEDSKLALEYLKHKKSDEFNTKQNLNVDGSLNINIVKFGDQEDGA